MMQNILITGGAGFIGSNFIRFIQNCRPEINIINLDLLSYAGNLENLADLPHPEKHQFIHGDICNQSLIEQLFETHSIDTVVHFAAESHVDRSINDPLRFVKTNVVGTTILLNIALNHWKKYHKSDQTKFRFHHISTDEVFGSLKSDDEAFTEETSYSPNSPYAASKAASDMIVRSYFQTFNLPITISNCSNNYGPYQFPEKLIPLVIQNALTGKPLPIYGDGKQVRDWLYVEDHCDAILRILENGTAGETYNIGGNNQPFNLEIVQTICGFLDEDLPESPYKPHFQLVKYVADRPGHDRRYAMNISKIKKELGWQPKESLQSGLRKTVQWYLNHQVWVHHLINRADYKDWITKNYSNR